MKPTYIKIIVNKAALTDKKTLTEALEKLYYEGTVLACTITLNYYCFVDITNVLPIQGDIMQTSMFIVSDIANKVPDFPKIVGRYKIVGQEDFDKTKETCLEI